jgi:Ca2+-binding EF-hand superfamily protein
MLSVAILLLSAQSGPVSAPAPEERRADLITFYRQSLEASDRDNDGKLSHSEWMAMVDTSFPEQPRPGEETDNYAEVRTDVIAEHRRLDSDGDGLVTFDELIREPLASFDCMDSDGNQRLSEAESWSGMARCASPG